MVNSTLFKSSCLIMIPQVLWEILVLPNHYHLLLSICTAASSIINHGFSKRNDWTVLFMYIDRIFIVKATIINVYMSPWPNLILSIIGSLMYALAKLEYRLFNVYNANLWHIFLHIIGSSSNVFVVRQIMNG